MHKKVVLLSLATCSLFANNTVEVPTINVNEKVNTHIVKDVSSEEIKSADLAEALSKNSPAISLVRRSGIANDIILRGQKKDNINITVDGAKIYGACPNRMDPTTSHILSNNVENVIIKEGPFDVENFGTLSGNIEIFTKQPSKDFGGEVNLNVGSFGYKKASGTVTGGNEYIKVLVSASTESSDQYEDGEGHTFYQQQVNAGMPVANRYTTETQDFKAYSKKTALTKAIVNLSNDAEIDLSYTLNRSDDILYPNTPMDANYDDSDVFTLGFTQRNLGDFSKELNVDYYYSKVDHPMSTKFRNNGAINMTNHMDSSMTGLKLKNEFEVGESLVTVGLDSSRRNWDGYYYNKTNTFIRNSISSTDTENKAIFSKYENTFGAVDIEVGARYDDTEIDTQSTTARDRDFEALSANVFATYNFDKNTKYFAGFGKSSRVPDARELYFVNSNGSVYGNEDLKQTKNYELDLGFEKIINDFKIKTKVFYSQLDDYIYNKNGASFENIDASIYGLEVSGMYFINDEFTLDYGLAYQRGKKDEALAGQTDKDLAEIPPLKGTIGINYELDKTTIMAQLTSVKSWTNYDSDNGEQELSGYSIVNLKYNYDINQNFDFTLGIDNLFDKTYSTTNTYKDIKYVATSGDPISINEPGRYVYVNLKYSF